MPRYGCGDKTFATFTSNIMEHITQQSTHSVSRCMIKTEEKISENDGTFVDA